MPVSGKIRILHYWTNQTDAEEVIRKLAETGLEFEAKLVRTHHDYVSALATRNFDLIIADDRAELSRPDALSSLEIAEELSPGIPFVLLCSSTSVFSRAENPLRFFPLARCELNRLGILIRDTLGHSGRR
jgi:hypothetical protein